MTTHTIELTAGYTDGDNATHSSVTFGKRLKGKDLFDMSDSPESNSKTQAALMMLAGSITKFGSLTLPVPLSVLMSLSRADRRKLSKGYESFLNTSSNAHKSKSLSDDAIKLGFGLTLGQIVYDQVRFGRMLNGYDELQSDDLDGWEQTCFLIGKEIVELSQSDGKHKIAGPISLEVFETADSRDIFALKEQEDKWLDSFRGEREEAEAETQNSLGADESSRNVGG